MRFYKAFEKGAEDEGSLLVVANNTRQARNLAWTVMSGFGLDEFVDVRVRWMRDESNVRILANRELLKTGQSHVVENIVVCESCEWWGCGITQERGAFVCADCGEYPGERLIKLFSEATNDNNSTIS